MDMRLGHVSAELTIPELDRTDELVRRLNEFVRPSVRLQESDVHVRAMFVVSTGVNSYGGTFAMPELQRLTELIVDAPVLVGHRRDSLPIGRLFHAELVERNGLTWVKAYFYWLRRSADADNLRENIDGGIYKECSISFVYHTPECSICGRDIRTCRHQPLAGYTDNGREDRCYFYYRGIERVLEASLVYRGAVADTGLTNELSAATLGHGVPPPLSPTTLDSHEIYLATPWYREGIEIAVARSGEGWAVIRLDTNETISLDLASLLAASNLPIDRAAGVLLGLRGRRRCSRQQLERFLEGHGSGVGHLEFRVLPVSDAWDTLRFHCNTSALRPMPYCCTDGSSLLHDSRELSTRTGLRIWRINALPPRSAGFVMSVPARTDSTVAACELTIDGDSSRAILTITGSGQIRRFAVNRFSATRFRAGRRFIAEPLDASSGPAGSSEPALPAAYALTAAACPDLSTMSRQTGLGAVRLCPATINGRNVCVIWYSHPRAAEEKHS